MNSIPSTSIILDTRRQKQDGTYPVKLRVTYERRQKYYAIGKSMVEDDFDKVIGTKPRGEYKKLKLFFSTVEKKANEAINQIDDFSFPAFEKIFKKQKTKNDVFAAYEDYIEQLNKEGRAGTASNYQCSLNSIKDFTKRKILHFSDVTVGFLQSYEKWMLDNGKSLTSVGIYLRCLRALFNEAIELGNVSQDLYPFSKRLYQIPSGRNVKKALTIADIEKIFKYQAPKGTNEARGKDLWIMSYLCNGINIKDIARLKYKNIDGETITFIRAKTERTTRKNQKPVVAILTAEVKEIIERWGNDSSNPENYVFPILEHGISADEELRRVRNLTRSINTYIKKIARLVGIEKEVSTYTARHSFSTVLKRSGAPIEYISESLGHNDLKTTESYLDSFEDKVRKEYAAKLTDFKRN